MKTELLKYIKNGDVYRLAGPDNKKARQEIIRIITGIKLPAARCGISTVRRGLFEVSGVQGDCLARKESALTEWLNS